MTAGNATGINDGAAAVMVMSAKKAAALGLTPLARKMLKRHAGVKRIDKISQSDDDLETDDE